MDHIHYDDIAAFEEAPLDCLSLDALFLELLVATPDPLRQDGARRYRSYAFFGEGVE